MANKTMNIYSYGLQECVGPPIQIFCTYTNWQLDFRDTTIMLVFEPPSTSKLYRDQFPVVWSKRCIHCPDLSSQCSFVCSQRLLHFAQKDTQKRRFSMVLASPLDTRKL